MIVYNATRINDLAASYATRLRTDGFTQVDARNWRGRGVTADVVLYNSPEHRATAEAVGRELGFPVERVPNLQVNGVAVVVFG